MTNVRLQRRLDSGDAGPIQVEMTPLQPTLLGLGQVREAFLDGGIWRYVVEAIIAVVSHLNPIIAAHQFVSACISVATRVLKHHPHLQLLKLGPPEVPGIVLPDTTIDSTPSSQQPFQCTQGISRFMVTN